VSAYAPTAVIRYPGRTPMGVDEFRAHLEQVKMALADLQIAPREHFATEHGVAAAWTFKATTKAGRTVTCDGIDSWVIGPGGKDRVGRRVLRPGAAGRGTSGLML
jgi:hypothetical protein